MNQIVSLTASFIAVSFGCINLSAHAFMTSSRQISSQDSTFIAVKADQSKLIAENRTLLVQNRALARKIAAKLGITSTGEMPTTGTPLEQNQVLILQNQDTFKEIAAKVGAEVPSLAPIDVADPAEKNHKLLLQNKSIVVSILKKLNIAPAPPPALTGTFVDKNHTLLKGNAGALKKIAAKLGVK